jgi:small subunit ribosomal protein S3Ae
VRAKWRLKKWYAILSSPPFKEMEVGSTVADDPSKVVGRVLGTSLYDLTKNFSHQYTLLYFQVVNVEGTKAYTIFKGHEILRDYIRSLIRRRSKKLDYVLDVATKDGYKMRLSVVALTIHRIPSSKEKSLRKVIRAVVEGEAKNNDFQNFVEKVVYGKLAERIAEEVKRIEPIRFMAVSKSRLIQPGGKSVG